MGSMGQHGGDGLCPVSVGGFHLVAPFWGDGLEQDERDGMGHDGFRPVPGLSWYANRLLDRPLPEEELPFRLKEH